MMEYYFVEYLPKSCFYCDCCHTKNYKHICGIKNMEVGIHYDHNEYDNDGRPDWCPLRMIPDDCLDKMIGK